MRELRLVLIWFAVVAGGFLLYVLWQLYQFAVSHPSTMQPWYIGVGVTIGLIALIIAGFIFAYWRERVRSHRLDNEQKLAALEFDKTAKLALETAITLQANHKIGPDRTLEVIHFFPTKVTMEDPQSQRQIAPPSSPILIPSAPSYRNMAHLMDDKRIITTYTAQGPVYGDISDLLSMALIGKPKRGKTTALLYYLCILLQAGAEVWIWDPHGEMHELAYGLNYYDSLDEITFKSVKLLHNELDQRDFIYKTQNKRVKHPLVLLVDEIPVITDWERTQQKMRSQQRIKDPMPSPYSVMKRFTLEARKWNCYVFISGQSLPADVLPTLTRDNLSSRLVLECSKDHARMIGLEKDAIDTLLPHLKGAERGTHIADFSSWSKPELADIPYTTIDDLRLLIDQRGNIHRRPSRPFTQDYEPTQYVHKAFTRPMQNSAKTQNQVITGELVNAPINTMNTPVNGSEDIIEVSPEERSKIIQFARIQQKMYGRVVRTKIRDAMGWNNKDYPKIMRVLNEEGL